ncbi:TPA: hypothetical protein ACF71I_003046, partial [Legionella pneumophila]
KYCQKRMKPNITVEERIVTTNLQIYYCSLCNKQLFILGGYNYKPFWERPIERAQLYLINNYYWVIFSSYPYPSTKAWLLSLLSLIIK